MRFSARNLLRTGATAALLACLSQSAFAQQLNENCTVSVLNRSVRVNRDGSWVLPNLPANFGYVRARATCVANGETVSGESDPFLIPPSGVVNLPPIIFGSTTPIPTSLAITTPTPTLTTLGATAQLTVTAGYSNGTTRDVTAAASGTQYTSSNPAIATISGGGLVQSVAAGTALVQATHEGRSGMIAIRVAPGGLDSDTDGIPDDEEVALGLDPHNGVDAQEDFDRDGLTNRREFQLGTNIREADTDGDGLQDGREVTTTGTNPLLVDTDGDGVPDGIEVQAGSIPTDPTSVNLAASLQSISVAPTNFTLVVNTIISVDVSQQFAVRGLLIDGHTTIDLTSTQRGTNYSSSDLSVCNFGSPDGRVFAGTGGHCAITVRVGALTATATGVVRSYAPTPLSFVSIPGYANNVDIVGNYAYVAAGSAGLQVVDVTERSRPSVVASRDTPGNANDVVVAGNFAYVADGTSGLQIVDIANPLAPLIVGSHDTPGEAWDLVVRGSLVYVADGSAGLQIISVANPAAPVSLGSLTLPGTARGVDVDAARQVAVVAAGPNGLHVVSVATAAAPVPLSTFLPPGGQPANAMDVVLSGQTALVADFERSLTAVDLTNPNAPEWRVSAPLETGGRLTDVAQAGPFAAGADIYFVNGVPIFDISTPSNPVPRAILDFRQFRDDNGTGVAIDGNFVYLTAAADFSDNGSNGDTRLYIGQYLALDDEAGQAPTVDITSPSGGTSALAETTITVRANASDDVGVAAVNFIVNGAVVFTDVAAPFEYALTVPASPALVIGAQAFDFAGATGTAENVTVTVTLGHGHVGGRVTDGVTGNGLQNAIVQIYGASGVFVTSATTDNAGNYGSTGLDPGTYFATTTGTPGYVNGLHSGRFCLNCIPTTGTGIVVADGASPTVNFALVRSARISGLVVDAASGLALASTWVAVYDARDRWVAGANADALGNFTIQDLAPGTYFVRAYSGDGHVNQLFELALADCCGITPGRPVVVGAGGTATDVNFSLRLGGRVSGQVVDASTGAGLGGVSIGLFRADGRYVSGAQTNPSGDYTSNGLDPGVYYARAESEDGHYTQVYAAIDCLGCNVTEGTPIAVSVGDVTTGADFSLMPGGGSISGHVTDAATGGAIGSGEVAVYDNTGRYITSGWLNPFGADPTFWITRGGLPAGTYYARAANARGYVRQLYQAMDCPGCAVTSGHPITVTAGTVTPDIDFALLLGGSISGRVTDAATGEGLVGINVQVFDELGRWLTAVDTGPTGSYLQTEGLPAGNYRVRTGTVGLHLTTIYGSGPCMNCDLQRGTLVPVLAGQTTTDIDLVLEMGGRVTGQVTDAVAGGPAATTHVAVMDPTGNWVADAGTDDQGHYATSGLRIGSYYVRTYNAAGYFNQLHAGQPCRAYCVMTAGTPVTVTAGADTPIDFALTPGGGLIAGHVIDTGTGTGLPTAAVEIYDAAGVLVSVGYPQGTASSYVIRDGLAPGTYYARALDNNGYISQAYRDLECVACAVTSGTPIDVGASATVSGIDFALGRGGRIAGRVTAAATGQGLPGVSVHVENAAGQFVTGGRTDSTGNYLTQVGLLAGTYFLRTFDGGSYVNAAYPNLSCPECGASTTGTGVAVAVDQTTTGIDFALVLGGRVAGRVTDTATGAGLAGVNIVFFRADGQRVIGAQTDSGGNYATNAIPTGTHYLRTTNARPYVNRLYGGLLCVNCTVTTGTPVVVQAGAIAADKDIALSLGAQISGRVTDATTAAGLSNVSVEIFNPLDQFITSTSTDLSGAYLQREALPPGTYYVKTFNAGNYQNGLYPGLLRFGNPVTAGTPLTLAAGDIQSGIDFALMLGGRISGLLTETPGVPLVNVNVQILSSGAFVTSVNTDSTGRYTTQGLGAGNYFVKTNSSLGHINELYNNITCVTCTVTTGTSVAVAAGQVTSDVDFELLRGGQISGVVRDPSGAPLAGVNVQIYNSTGTFLVSVNTNASGQYTTQGLAAGTYYVRTNNSLGYINLLYQGIDCLNCAVLGGTPVLVVAGQVTSGVDLQFHTRGLVLGIVTAHGVAQSGLTVQVFDAATGFQTTSVSTSSTGQFLVGVPAGTYFIRTTNTRGLVDQIHSDGPPIFCSGSFCLGSGAPVHLADGDVAEVQFNLEPGGVIAGTVRDEATDLGLPGVTVNVQDATGRSVTAVSTNASGGYSTVLGLPPGTYFVRTTEPSRRYVDQYYAGALCVGNNCVLSSATPVTVASGATVGSIDFALHRGGRFSGTVTDAGTGMPIAGVTVGVTMVTGAVVATAGTDVSGNFTTGVVPAGTYYLKTSNNLGYLNAYADGTECAGSCLPTIGAPSPVTVADDDTLTGLNFSLRPGGRISGRGVNAAGNGLPGVAISIYDETGRLVSTASTDSAGNYVSADGLPSGTYFGRTSNSQGYIDGRFDGLLCIGCPMVTATPISVTIGSTTSGIDFQLVPGGRISGTVTTDAGLPLTGLTVQIFDSAGRAVTSGTTNNFGMYTSAAGMAPGSYFLRTPTVAAGAFVSEIYPDAVCIGLCDIANGTAVDVSGTSTVTSIDFHLSQGGRVAGRVTRTDLTPIGFATVSLFDHAGSVVSTTVTDVHGRYLVGAGVVDGNYFARTFAPDVVSEVFDNVLCLACDVTSATPIAVSAPGITADVNFDLVAGGRIAGTVTRATGEPVPGVRVGVYDSTGTQVAFGTSGVDGRYVTSSYALPAGTYFVRTENSFGLRDELYGGIACAGPCNVTAGTGVTVVVGSTTTGVDFSLGPEVMPPAPAPVAVGPTGSTATDIPAFRWRPVPGAVGYILVVEDSAQQTLIDVEYSGSDVRCGSGTLLSTTTCTATTGVHLPPGAGQWRVAAVTGVGVGAFSSATSFTVE